MTNLLLGIFIAATVFGGLLWAGYRAYLTSGTTRLINLVVAVLTILLMAMITWQMGVPGRLIGGALAVFALIACAFERGFSRFLPLSLSALGTFAALGAPFA